MTSRVDFSNLNVHKMLQGFVSLVLDKTLIVDAAAKESESRKLRNLIDDQSRHLPSQSEFSVLMNKLMDSGSELLNQPDLLHKISGIFVLDCLLDINEELVTDRRMNIATSLRKIFENSDKVPLGIEAGLVILRICAQLIGHLAGNATTAETEYLQTFYFPIAMRLVGTVATKSLLGSSNNTDKEDFLKLSGCVLLTELANNCPDIIFGRRKQVFASVWEVVCDKSNIVREAGAEALQSCLLVISQRESMGEWVAVALDRMDQGFSSNTSERILGSMLILDIVIGGLVVPIPELQNIMKMVGRAFHTTINSVLQFRSYKDELVRKRVINILPQLAAAFSATFTGPNQFTAPFTFLHFTIHYLIELIKQKQKVRGDQERQIAYISLGKLVSTMSRALQASKDEPVNPVISDILSTIKQGFTRDEFFCVQALDCLGLIVNAIPSCRSFVDRDLIECMFRGGVTFDLIANLTIITKHVPIVQSLVQSLLLTHIKSILKSYDVSLARCSRTMKSHINHIESGSLFKPDSRTTRSNSLSGLMPSDIMGFAFSSADDSTVGKRSDRYFRSPFGIRDKISAALAQATGPKLTDPKSLIAMSQTQQSEDSDNQIILALQILGSPDFFTKENTNTKSKFTRTRLRSSEKVSTNDMGMESLTTLLRVVSDVVIRYLDDFSPDVRAATVATCARILDTTAAHLQANSEEYTIFMHILTRVLIVGVGDDLKSIRLTAFQSLSSTLDKYIAESENLYCIVQACNDESTAVRVAAMEVISRVAHFDTLHIMPTIRVMLHRLMSQLQNFTEKESQLTSYTIFHESESIKLRLESVQLLQAMIRGATVLIAPYVNQILEVLVPLLSDTSTFIARSALASIADLSIASPEVIRDILDDLFPHLIQSLKDVKSVDNQETAVEALGKLVSSLAMATEDPYSDYDGLFEGLVGIILSDDTSTDLQLKAIKTAGLLGVVEPEVYNTQMQAYRNRQEGNQDEDEDFEASNAKASRKYTATQANSGQVQLRKKGRSGGKQKTAQDSSEQYMQADIEVMLIEREEKEDYAVEQKQYLEKYLLETKEKKIVSTEKFYLNVVMRSLAKILRDPTLPACHQSASQICIRIMRIVGPQGHFLVSELLAAIIYRLHNLESGNNMITALLDHVMTIVHIMGRLMRPHLNDLVNLIIEYFPSRGNLCMDLVESLAHKLPFPYFNMVLREVLPLILQKLQSEPQEFLKSMTEKDSTGGSGSQSFTSTLFGTSQNNIQTQISSNLPNTSVILQSFINMSDIFSDHHKQVIIPSILQVLDFQHKSITETRKKALDVVLALVDDEKMLSYANQIVLPLMRILNDTANVSNTPRLQTAAITALSFLVCRLGTSYTPFIIPVRRNMNAFLTSLKPGSIQLAQLDEYNNFINRLLEHRPLPIEPSDASDMHVLVDERIRNRIKNVRLAPEKYAPPVLSSLEQAWALAGRNNATDLGEWMNRLANELIRQSPSPFIRACAALAKTHRPLAEELFTVCFVCIWDELFLADTNDVVDDNSLIHSMELALRSPQISPNLMTSLLNLAEFMDMQDKRLPLDVTLLARCAEKANMYAKSLRYRELQFNSDNLDPNGECIEALISVNNQMGRPERAFGVLDYLSMEDINVEPSWLEKLMRWGDAKESYSAINAEWKEKYPDGSPTEHPEWLGGELGVLRCSHALGEYSLLLEAATTLERHLKSADLTQSDLEAAATSVQHLGAHSAWMLGKWGEMDSFLAVEYDTVDAADSQQLVEVTTTSSFYRSVLAIHKEDFSGAQDYIDATRAALAGTISSLLSESYTRAYPAMVSMQILSELEEIVEYKRASQQLNIFLESDKESLRNMFEEYGHTGTTRSRSNSAAETNGGSPFTKNAHRGSNASEMEQPRRRSNAEDIPPAPMLRRNSSVDSSDRRQSSADGSVVNGTVDAKRWKSAGFSDGDIRIFDMSQKKQALIQKWNARLKWAPKEVSVYSQVLAVHTLVAEPSESLDAWIELVKLCRKEGMFTLCENILRRLGAKLPEPEAQVAVAPGSMGIKSIVDAMLDGADSSPRTFISIQESMELSTIHERETETSFDTSMLKHLKEMSEGQTGSSGNTFAPPTAHGSGNTTAMNTRANSPTPKGDRKTKPLVEFAYMKYLWHSGEREKALKDLSAFVKEQEEDPLVARITAEAASKRADNATISIRQLVRDALAEGSIESHLDVFADGAADPSTWGGSSANKSSNLLRLKQDKELREAVNFRVKVLLKRSEWMRELSETAEERADMLDTVLQARNIAECRHSVWHAWAVTNYDQLQKLVEARVNPTTDEPAVQALLQKLDTKAEEVEKPVRNRSDSNNVAPSWGTSLPSIKEGVGGSPAPKVRPSAKDNSLKEPKQKYSHQLAAFGATSGTHANAVGLPKHTLPPDKKKPVVGEAIASNQLNASEEIGYAAEAIKGFVRSIILGHGKPVTYVLEDTLRLLTLWFTYGGRKEVFAITGVEIENVAPDCWLGVLPQLIARMYVKTPEIYKVLQSLLTKLAKKHPQALVCPISVALNTQNSQQKMIASHVLKEMRKKDETLVEEATMISRELMRAAASPHEMWKEHLEAAYGLYMGRDPNGATIPTYAARVTMMLQTLTEMHDAMTEAHIDVSANVSMGFSESSGNIGFTTLRDISFRQSYGRQLAAAKDLLDQFQETGCLATLHELWEIYFEVIQRTEVNINAQKKVQLNHVSPELTSSRNLMLCVPGTYVPNSEVVSIAKFVNTLNVIMSKQRPRRLAMLGSNGQTYDFLLKGKEDLRQDERVMQLFGLINVCLEKNRSSGLNIVRYSVLPLSNNSGLIGWVQNCDTFAGLLSAYRSERGIPITLEAMMLRAKLGGGHHIRKYDRLPLLNKVEIFESILEETRGKDLETMLWLKSKTADAWVERRDNFTRSMAVMSIVGYILGLGDRHMANIMLDKISGRVVHIDFGDSFEVNKTRALYPETIPFRLTRMLTNCMGHAGMAGTFKVTAYKVMRVLHENRDSVLAMLEAFVYDPMVGWRVLASTQTGQQADNIAAQSTNLAASSDFSATDQSSVSTQMMSGTLQTSLAASMLNSSMAQLMTSNEAFEDNSAQEAEDMREDALFEDDAGAELHLANQSMTFKIKPMMPTLQSVNPADHAVRMSMRQATFTYKAAIKGKVLANVAPTAAAGIPNNAGATIMSPAAIAAAAATLKPKPMPMPMPTAPAATDDEDTQIGVPTEKLNARALDIISRIQAKLTGWDFSPDDGDEIYLTVEEQVDRLIQEATSNENLCALYSGWQPWW